MAPVPPELHEQIQELATSLTNVAISYRYTKARTMLDPEFAERQRESKRVFYKKRYAEDPEFRKKALSKSAANLSVATAKRQEKYHNDEDYRARRLQQCRESRERRKAKQAIQARDHIAETSNHSCKTE
jgi:hypothetical protein